MGPLPGRRRVVKLRARGEIIIPVRLRRRLGWAEGTFLSVQQSGDAVVVRALAAGGEGSHPSWSKDQFLLYDRLQEESATAAELGAELGWPAGRIRSALLGLLVRGVVTVDEEGRYSLAPGDWARGLGGHGRDRFVGADGEDPGPRPGRGEAGEA